jgi:DNA repair exonuclease SbcCD ATPase subunit
MKSDIADDVVKAVVVTLETIELPKLEEKLANGDGDAAIIQRRRIAALRKQMQEYRDQEDEQYDLLEKKKYTQELFDRRNAALRAKMDKCEKDLFKAQANMPENVDYAERIASLKKAIAALKDPDLSNRETNSYLRDIVEKIKYIAPPVGSKETNTKLKVKLRL